MSTSPPTSDAEVTPVRSERSDRSGRSDRSEATAKWGLAILSAVLLALPLGVPKPGLPMTMKADEPAYYLMALSLARDGDVRCELQDIRRLFTEFPSGPAHNLVLTSDDGWRTLYFGKPFVYPLVAAPFAAIAGGNGILLCNMAMLVAMIWLGFLHLRRFNDDGLAALFSAAFFLLSVAWNYAFWLQPEVFNMASVAGALYLGVSGSRWQGRLGLWAPALSGAVLALGAFNKPMVLAFALPVWFAGQSPDGGGLRRTASRAARRFAVWMVGAVGMLGLLSLGSALLTGHPSPYLGGERAGYDVLSPDRLPVEPLDPNPVAPALVEGASPEAGAPGSAAAPAATPARPRRTWWWILRIPDVPLAELVENTMYFLVGRHTGLLLYLPFGLVATALFLWRGNRNRGIEGWALLASIVAFGAFFLLFIPFNWHGGGGFVGNRYFVNGYPAFLFLVGAIAPRWLILAGAAWASLTIGTLLVTPFGRAAPFPTLQAHVRGDVFRHFPLELSLRNVPGYVRGEAGGLGLVGRRDQVLEQGDALWLHAATPVEVWLQSLAPLEELELEVESRAFPNRVVLTLGEAREVLEFADSQTESRRVRLRPGTPDRRRQDEGRTIWIYRLGFESTWGELRHWTAVNPPPKSDDFAFQPTSEETFFTGAAVRILGTPQDLARNVFQVDWKRCELPPTLLPGQKAVVPVTVANASGETWPAKGPSRVAFAAHWRGTTAGGVPYELWDGERTILPRDLGARETVDLEIRLDAPPEAGSYELTLDGVREHVAWFSERGAAPCRATIAVR